MTDIAEVIEKAIKEGGYDGLYNEDAECACQKNDLWPADCIGLGCKLGVFVDCKEVGLFASPERVGLSGYDYCIGAKK